MTQQARRTGKRFFLAATAAVAVVMSLGCETNSFIDPSVVGRWQRTPVMLPILDQLDVIDEPSSEPAGLSQVQPDDLTVTAKEYVIGTEDLVTVTIFELLVPGVESVQTRRVDELGLVRLPVVGTIKAEGHTPSQLERTIARTLQERGILKDATVSVLVQEQRHNVFNVIGESSTSSTAIGTYNILKRDFRVLDAVAMARGVPGSIKKIYVMRPQFQTNVVFAPSDDQAPATDSPTTPDQPNAPTNPTDLIQDLLQPTAPAVAPAGQVSPSLASTVSEQSRSTETNRSPWVQVDGQWVRTGATTPADSQDMGKNSGSETSASSGESKPDYRIIEIPYDKLLQGETKFNIVIRPNDTIRIPAPVIGNVYVGGAINRPGTYALPGDRDLTLKQLIIAAGGPASIAIPERTDLIRRIGNNQEAVVRLNLKAIFAGTQPDVFLKPNDTINLGTNFFATPLAVIRNGFRMSYGFGFILDRNFSENVFGPTSSNN